MVIVTEGRIKRRVPVNDIVFCDIDKHYSQFHLKCGMLIRFRMTFSDVSALLNPYPQFLQCYRGCIVNMDYGHIAEEMNFLMDTGERVPYRKKEHHSIVKRYSDYILNKS